MRKWRSYSIQYFSVLVVLYVIASLIIPLSRDTRQAYNLGLAQAHIISLISVLPLFAIWFAAFYCYGRLQKYAESIKASREGPAFKKIANGVAILSWGLVIQAYVSLTLGGLSDSLDNFHNIATILQSYMTLVFPLVALPLIGIGTRQLLEIKRSRITGSSSHILMLIFAAIAAIYCYLVINLSQQNSNPYGLPTGLLLSTVVVPYLFAWFSGLLAAFEMVVHAKITHGLLYKNGLRLLAFGLTVFIVSSILVQYLNSAFISNLGVVSINAVLLIDYLLLLGVALGYLLMIAGVRRLQKIEEI